VLELGRIQALGLFFWLYKGESVNRPQMEAVMDVIGSQCVSPGSSTVQLHDSIGSRRACTWSEAGFSSQCWPCLRGVLQKSSVLLCVSCWKKDSLQRTFIKKCFLFTAGSVCHVKRFTTGWQTFRWWRRGWNGGAEVAETTVERLSMLLVLTHWWSDGTGVSMLVEDTGFCSRRVTT
jgi:hypothetical protein